MTRRLVMLLAAAVLALARSGGAQAAELPRQFHGRWVAAEAPNRDKCRMEEPKGEDDRPVDVMMYVAPVEITYYEQRCKVQSAKVLHAPNPDETGRLNADVRLACSGEGMRWSAREIWHFETIDGRKIMAVTALRQSNYRTEKGKRQYAPSRITTSIYYPCTQ